MNASSILNAVIRGFAVAVYGVAIAGGWACGSGDSSPTASDAAQDGPEAGEVVDAPSPGDEVASDDGPSDGGPDDQAVSADTGGPPPDAPDDPVTGTVVDLATTRPLSNRTVMIGAQKAVTDAKGAFAISHGAATYDVTIVDPDGSTVSIYRGLTRRDPTLGHVPSDSPVPRERQGEVSGELSGGGPYPVGPMDALAVYFFSDEADGYALLGGALPPGYQGPAYGPIRMDWSGPESIAGELVVLGTFTANGQASTTWFGHRDLMVTTGANGPIALPMNAASTTSLAGHIEVSPTASVQQKQVFYRRRRRHAMVGLANDATSSPSFELAVPDLGELGGELCVVGAASPGLALTQKCAIPPGTTDVAVAVQDAPTLSAPMEGAPVSKTTSFRWSPFTNGVYLLSLSANGATRAKPSIRVFTASTSATWPDLSALGVAFPANSDYRCSIEGMGAFDGIDDAVGPAGLSDPFPVEMRRSRSAPRSLRTVP